MASEMLEKILEAENTAKKNKENCENEAKSLILKAENQANELIKKSKSDAEAEAKIKISEAEEKAAALIEKKRTEAFAECSGLSELAANKQKECNAAIINKIIV